MTELTVLGNPASMKFVKLSFLMGLPLIAYLIYDIIDTDRHPKLWQLHQRARPSYSGV